MNTASNSILIVEDDPKIASLLKDYLVAAGYSAECLGNGLQALRQLRAAQPAALILDVMLPGMDGVALCKAVRTFSTLPILMLTAKVEEDDRLLGLDGGADDYVCKPFSPREVVARVRALLRRSEGLPPGANQHWQIDQAGQRIAWRDHWLPLTPVEYRLLHQLIEQPGRVFTRQQLLDAAHADTRDVSDRVVDSHIKNLRRKLQDIDPGCECVASVYGVGYRFDRPD